jgi:AraC-like DNA-binding protein
MMLNTFDWYPIYIPLAILIYWLGIKGFMMSNSYSVATIKKNNGINSSLPVTAITETALSLKRAMEQNKLYLDPLLNLQIISKHTNISQKTISAVLNQHLHKSFNEFVNEYRIEAFKEKLQDPELDHLTIAGIAFDCGFNSQATFQRTFKQFTGLSPSEYRNGLVEIE